MIIGRRGRARRTLVALTAGLIAASAAALRCRHLRATARAKAETRGAIPTPARSPVDLPTDPNSCDPLGGARCLLPFPNDYFTVADRSAETGRRVDLAADATPANTAGVHIDPTELNRNDGFSPGSALVALLPGIDLAASGRPRSPTWAARSTGAADRRHRRHDRQAAPLLGRARQPGPGRRPPAPVRPRPRASARAIATSSPSATSSIAPDGRSSRPTSSAPIATGSTPASMRSRPACPHGRPVPPSSAGRGRS